MQVESRFALVRSDHRRVSQFYPLTPSPPLPTPQRPMIAGHCPDSCLASTPSQAHPNAASPARDEGRGGALCPDACPIPGATSTPVRAREDASSELNGDSTHTDGLVRP